MLLTYTIPFPISRGFDPLPEDVSSTFCSRFIKRRLSICKSLDHGGVRIAMEDAPFYARDMAVNDALKELEKSFVSNAYRDFSVKDVDIWNEEDYSLMDKRVNPRGLDVNVRSYVRNLRGYPLCRSFDQTTYSLRFKSEPGVPRRVIYIPETI